PVFGGRGEAVPPGFMARDEAGVLVVSAGRVQGIVEGAELRLLGLDGKSYGQGRVTDAKSTWCEAAWTKAPDAFAAGTALREQPLGPLHGRAGLRVRLEPGIDKGLLADCPWARPVDSNPDYVLARRGDGLELREPDGTAVRAVHSEPAAASADLFGEYS